MSRLLACSSLWGRAARHPEPDAPGRIVVLEWKYWEAHGLARKHRLLSRLWGALHFALGVPSAALAAVGGAVTVQQGSASMGPALCLVGALVSAAVAFLNCKRERDIHTAHQAGWTKIADDALADLFVLDHVPAAITRRLHQLQADARHLLRHDLPLDGGAACCAQAESEVAQ